VKIGLTCAVNVETHDNSSFSFERKVEGDPVLRKCLDSRLVIIEHGAWISIGKKLNTFNKGYMQTKSMPCPSILDTIAINPFGEILACCGLTSEQNPYLRLGNINNIGVKEAYEKSFQDIVKIWLSVDGPNRILNYVNNKKGNSEMEYKDHMCRICSELFSDKSNIDILKTFNHEYSPSVYLKYVLTNKLTDNEEKTN